MLVKISLCLPGIALGQETLRLKQTTKIASDGKTTTRDFEYTSDGHIERIIESTNGSKTRVDHIIYDKTSVTTNIDDGADGTINRYQLEMLDKTDGRLLGFFLIDKDKQVLNVISENSFNESGLITGWELKRPNPDCRGALPEHWHGPDSRNDYL